MIPSFDRFIQMAPSVASKHLMLFRIVPWNFRFPLKSNVLRFDKRSSFLRRSDFQEVLSSSLNDRFLELKLVEDYATWPAVISDICNVPDIQPFQASLYL